MTDNPAAAIAVDRTAYLYHDGSDAAEKLLGELLRRDVMHEVTYDASAYALSIGAAGMLTQDTFSLNAMMIAIRLEGIRRHAALKKSS